ncbi:serine/threonine protein kinase [Nocardiopsis mwathae]|uniref:non-specific serine/threonine protein kinase n=1 Tax=Nocardiopsis mwathae TaxID=1472723 RepID=A0A7X0D786_9ACTN|nr:serine/threonine-protein kinase [Nocardiopsis mwathae]MBB6173451.1 serine/threonine protein kinase [Nocardiopsis mwathae]
MTKSEDGGERVIADRYRLRSALGAGGMGTVWLAWDPELARDVAVKEVLLPDGLSGPERDEAHARVRREARSAARIAHPSVVTIHDVLDFEGHPWVVMELLRGRSLQQELAANGPMDPQRVAVIAVQLLEAVRAAHAAGVIHRDIKPGNVMLADGDRVTLTDFGIATLEGGATITRTGVLVGSPEYMSPERLHSEQATAASDLWSVGVTLYAMSTGASPFHRDSITGAIAAVLSAPIPPLGWAGPLAPVIGGLLERDPGRRLTADRALALLAAVAPPNGPDAASGERPSPPNGPPPWQGPVTPHPSGPVTPRPTGPATPQPHAPPAPRPGGPATPHPALGPPPAPIPAAPIGAWPAPPAAFHAGREKPRRRSRVGLWALLIGAVVVAAVAFLAAVAVVMSEEFGSAPPMRTYSNQWYSIGYPEGWDYETPPDEERTIRFQNPDGTITLTVVSWELTSSDPQTAREWVELYHEEVQNEEGVEVRRVIGTAYGFPSDWDVGHILLRYTEDAHDDQIRRLDGYVIVYDGEYYGLAWDTPWDAPRTDLHDSIVDSFKPRT